MRSETAISLVLLALSRNDPKGVVGTREQIAAALERIQSTGIHLPIRLRPTPTGLTSAELAEFLGKMLIAGFVTQESPVRLREEGIRLLQDHVRETAADPSANTELDRAAQALGVTTAQLAAD